MGRARRAGEPELELRLLGPLEALSGRPSRASEGPSRAHSSRCSRSSRRMSSPSTASSRRSGPAKRPRPPRTPSRSTSPSSVRRLARRHREAAPGYSLELEPERVDLHRFVAPRERRSRDARGRRRRVSGRGAFSARPSRSGAGPALADFVYEPFAQTEIARLEELRTVVLEERIEADLALGRHAELVSELEALVAGAATTRAPARAADARALPLGRQADALAAYRAARETLVEELGIDPGPELKALEAAILRQDESLLLAETPLAEPAMQFRRLVTILFVDVIESMALAEALDPEALGQGPAAATSRPSPRRSRDTAARSRSSPATQSWRRSASRSRTRTTRSAPPAPRSTSGWAIAALNEQLVNEHGIGLEVRIGIETGEVVATPTDARQRLVTGEAVGIAARLEQAADADEIVVGELAGRLIDHAATLEPLGELEIKGKREPVHAYRLLELTPGRSGVRAAPGRAARRAQARAGGAPEIAEARGRRLDCARRDRHRPARGRQVAARRGARAPREGRDDALGPLPLVRRGHHVLAAARGARAARGRARSATPSSPRSTRRRRPRARDRLALPAVLRGVARDQPLVLVFDDVHWAEPTFLELVEHLADKGKGRSSVVCLAREELLEDRPAFLEGRANVERIVLDALSAEETDALLDGLGGDDPRVRSAGAHRRGRGGQPVLPRAAARTRARRRARRAPAAGDGPGPARGAPRPARPRRAAVLERGAVVGNEFTAGRCRRAARARGRADRGRAPPDARGAASSGRATTGLFGFRHVARPGGGLPRGPEATARGAPRALRRPPRRRDGRISPTSTSSSATTSSGRIDCGRSSARPDRRTGAARPRTPVDAWARRAFAPRSAATCPRPSICSGARRRCLRAMTSRSTRAPVASSGSPCDAAGDPRGVKRRAGRRCDAGRERPADRRVELRALDRGRVCPAAGCPGRRRTCLLDGRRRGDPHLRGYRRRPITRPRVAFLAAWVVRGWMAERHRPGRERRSVLSSTTSAASWPTATAVGEIAAALYWGPTSVSDGDREVHGVTRRRADASGW